MPMSARSGWVLGAAASGLAFVSMVTRRGMRLEADEPTEWQKRNKRWLADHPVIVSLVGAVLFSSMLGLLGSSGESRSGLGVGLVLGAVAGAGLGLAFSIENRESVARGAKILAYSLCGLGVLALFVVKAL